MLVEQIKRPMRLRIFLLLLAVISISLCGYSQVPSAISGKILNKDNLEPLPYASIRLKNHPIGTVSNEEGEFDFYIPKSKRNDTLSISFIGFNPYELPISAINGEVKVELSPSVNVLALSLPPPPLPLLLFLPSLLSSSTPSLLPPTLCPPPFFLSTVLSSRLLPHISRQCSLTASTPSFLPPALSLSLPLPPTLPLSFLLRVIIAVIRIQLNELGSLLETLGRL